MQRKIDHTACRMQKIDFRKAQNSSKLDVGISSPSNKAWFKQWNKQLNRVKSQKVAQISEKFENEKLFFDCISSIK